MPRTRNFYMRDGHPVSTHYANHDRRLELETPSPMSNNQNTYRDECADNRIERCRGRGNTPRQNGSARKPQLFIVPPRPLQTA